MNYSLSSFRELFRRTIQVRAVRVQTKQINTLMKLLKPHSFAMHKLRPVVDDVEPRNPPTKLILLKPSVSSADLLELPEIARNKIRDTNSEVIDYNVQVTYENESVDSVLRKLLPADVEVPSAYEQAGHIAHMNLRSAHEPHKQLIGQVLLDKNPPLKTVVNKIGSIATEFRTFPMEILAGVDDMMTEVRENKCRFKFDFSKVYWNSRLGEEHTRLTKTFKPNEIIYDMFAGVGPFAIPAVSKGCIVFANDLNPESYKYLNENIKLNKISKSIYCFNLDAREFIKTVFVDRFIDNCHVRSHIPMNLPATAIRFLDVFRGVLSQVEDSERAKMIMPTIHCYCFTTRIDDIENDMKERISESLGAVPEKMSIHRVRDVAPKKWMLCVSFELPAKVAFGRKRAIDTKWDEDIEDDDDEEYAYDSDQSETSGNRTSENKKRRLN